MLLRETNEPLFDDEALIRRYILGDVSEDERSSIERRLMTDPEYLGRLRLVETDLADDYERGALGGRERKRFERHFLSAPQHRQKVRVAGALRNYIATQRETAASANRLRPAVKWRLGSAAVFSMAVITLVLVAVIAGLVIQRRQMRRELQRFEALTLEQEAQLQDLTRQAEDARSRQAQLEQAVAELMRPAEGEVVLSDSGANVMLDGRGNLRGLDAIPAQMRESIKVALASGRVAAPESVMELAGATNVLMGPSEGVPFALRAPVATAVFEQRPRFRWKELRGAVSYTVSIFDPDFRRVAKSEALTTTEWLIPQSLDRGAVYSWQVTALKDGREVVSPVRPAPEARFRVLDQAAAEEVDRYRRSGTNSHLAAGVVYARAGLRDDAEGEFLMLVKENPRSSVARRLLRSVK
jgi:hypothetical protein